MFHLLVRFELLMEKTESYHFGENNEISVYWRWEVYQRYALSCFLLWSTPWYGDLDLCGLGADGLVVRNHRSRFGQATSAGSYCITSLKSRYPSGARAIGVPGWPLLAACTASIERVRIVSIAFFSAAVMESGIASNGVQVKNEELRLYKKPKIPQSAKESSWHFPSPSSSFSQWRKWGCRFDPWRRTDISRCLGGCWHARRWKAENLTAKRRSPKSKNPKCRKFSTKRLDKKKQANLDGCFVSFASFSGEMPWKKSQVCLAYWWRHFLFSSFCSSLFCKTSRGARGLCRASLVTQMQLAVPSIMGAMEDW